MLRSLIAALAASLVAASLAAGSAQANSLPFSVGSPPRDVVSAGRFQFFITDGSQIGRIASDGSLTWFPSGFPAVERLIVGPAGDLWFIGSGPLGTDPRLGRMTQSGVLLSKTDPMSGIAVALANGPDGHVWVAEGYEMAEYAANGALLEQHTIPGAAPAVDVTSGPDGNLWIPLQTPVANVQAAILKMTPAGATHRFEVGPDCAPASPPFACARVRRIAVGPDNSLWYTMSLSSTVKNDHGAVGRLTTGGFSTHLVGPPTSIFSAITSGPDRQIYVLDSTRQTVGRFDTATGTFTDGSVWAAGLNGAGDFSRGGLVLAADGAFWSAAHAKSYVHQSFVDLPPDTGNLLRNGDAESGPTTVLSSAAVPVVGWATSAGFSTGSFQQFGGKRMMWGGPNNGQSYARQIVDLRGQAAAIDAATRVATLSGQIGGYGGQADSGTLTARFAKADGTILGEIHTAPVTPANLGGVSGYSSRTISGAVPAGTRYVEIEALAKRVEGNSNDAFFDDLSFTVAAASIPYVPVVPAVPVGPVLPVVPAGQAPGEGGGSGSGPGEGAGSGAGASTGSDAGGPGTTGTARSSDGSGPGVGRTGEALTPASATRLQLAPAAFEAMRSGGPTTVDRIQGTLLSLTLSRASTVTIRFDRAAVGRRRGKACVAAPVRRAANSKTSAKRAKSCTRYTAAGTFAVDQPAGVSSIHLSGRTAKAKLPRGKYHLVLTPAGGAPATVAMRIL